MHQECTFEQAHEGRNDINNEQSDVTNRSIKTLLECNEFGVFP